MVNAGTANAVAPAFLTDAAAMRPVENGPQVLQRLDVCFSLSVTNLAANVAGNCSKRVLAIIILILMAGSYSLQYCKVQPGSIR